MSYDLKCKIFIKNEEKFSSYANFLKSINKTRYNVDLMVEPCKCDLPTPKVEEGSSTGYWYSYNSFCKTQGDLLNYYNNSIEKKFKLEQIKNSEKYYMLNSEQKDDLLEDIEMINESINDFNYSYDACVKMLGIIDFVSEIYSEYNLDNIKIYIYAI